MIIYMKNEQLLIYYLYILINFLLLNFFSVIQFFLFAFSAYLLRLFFKIS